MTNNQMKSGRFLRWHEARRKIEWIVAMLEAGTMVQLTTYGHAMRYTRKHTEMFKATRSGAYVQSGYQWVCIDGCQINGV